MPSARPPHFTVSCFQNGYAKPFDETIDRLAKVTDYSGWWKTISNRVSFKVVAPDRFKVESIRECLAEATLKNRMLKKSLIGSASEELDT